MRRLLLLSVLTLFLHVTSWAYDFEVDGIYYNVTNFADGTCEVTRSSSDVSVSRYDYQGSVVIPSSVEYNNVTYSVTRIGTEAFYYCFRLTKLTIPNTIISIGECSFYNCALTEFSIPNSVTSIEAQAFSNMTSLKELTIGESVESIGMHAFSYSTSLTEVAIPNSVKSIGHSLFSGCSNLKKVTIGNSLTSITYSAFYNCTSLTEVVMSNSVTNIEEGVFEGCKSLTEITIPNSVTNMGSKLFNGCSSLSNVVIGNSVKDIGDNAFYGCSALKSITSLNPAPPTCGSDVFYDVSKFSCILYVPIGAGDEYSSKNVWKDFQNIVEIDVYSPTVQTYEATDITYNSALLKGAITTGEWEILGQGFEYWAEDGEVHTVEAEGEDIMAELEGLEEATVYSYRAYATTENGIVYGETLTFTTLNVSLLNALTGEINEVMVQLSETWEAITNECPDVVDKFKSDYDALSDELENLQQNVESAYNEGELSENFAEATRAEIEDINQKIDSMLADAQEAQKETGIEDIIADSGGNSVVYNLAGGRVCSLVKGNVYVLKYSDGTAKKILVK